MKPTKISDITPEYVVECYKKHGLRPATKKLAPGKQPDYLHRGKPDNSCCALGAVAIDLGADKESGNDYYISRFLSDNIEDTSGDAAFTAGFDAALSCWISYDKDVARQLALDSNLLPLSQLGASVAIACAEAFYP